MERRSRYLEARSERWHDALVWEVGVSETLEAMNRARATLRDHVRSRPDLAPWGIAALGRLLVHTGQLEEASATLRLARPDATPASLRAHLALGEALTGAGRYAESLEVLGGVRERARARDDEEVLGLATVASSLTHIYLEDLAGASEILDEAPGGGRAHARVLSGRARIEHMAGRREQALGLFEQALGASRACDDGHTQTRVIHNLGIFYTDQSDFAQAQDCLERAIERHALGSNRVLMAQAYNSLGVLHMRARSRAQAVEAYATSMRMFQEAGLPLWVGMTVVNRALLSLDHEEYDVAMATLEQGLHLLRGAEDRYLRGMMFVILGCTRWCLGDLRASRQALDVAVEIANASDHIELKVNALAHRAALLCKSGEEAAAAAMFEEASRFVGSHAVLEEVITVHRLHLTLLRHRRAANRGKTCEAHRLLFEVVDALAPRRALGEASEALRCARRLVELNLPTDARRLLDAEAEDASGERFLHTPDFDAIRAPGAKWIDLSRSSAMLGMVRALVEQHERAPGESIEAAELQARVWKGEILLPQAANNRMHVTISKLRKVGLRGCLQRVEEGYRLDPALRAVCVEVP